MFLLALAAVAALSKAPLFATQDLPLHGNTLRLIVTGDAGATHSRLLQGMLRVHGAKPVDAILLVGDNFYPCGIASTADPQWSKITEHFVPLHIPIYAILGNHDYGDPQIRGSSLWTCGSPDPEAELEETQIPEWHFPARTYALHSPLVDIIMLDTQPIASGLAQSFRGSATSAEIKSFLNEQLIASHAAWRLVAGHHTIYSSGMHGRTDDYERANMRALLPLLQNRTTGADLYICGHDHDLELIGDRDGRARPLFLISGAASGLDQMKVRHHGVEPATLFPHPIEAFFGFAVLEIQPATLTITFYDERGTQRGFPFKLTQRLR